ncbi:NADP-dependent phosphogluconate dehydrogenase, partial [Actinacidiphila oryziradicis]|uniref:NADP-dependent phosphogluconate dehydrogenase n=1 Tax=Actinacidiphila oryziradicis TaxID=2571141 RepID=UPI0023F39E64
MTTPTAQIGVTGLAVMGRNLARNFARHGHTVAIHNRTAAKTTALAEEFGHEGTFIPATTAAEFVAALERPRRLVIMVKAGGPTDAVIDEFAPLLEPGDMIIDGGNAHFADTRRREAALRPSGVHFVGAGISGGEEGALHGPSIMPGGSPESYESLGPLLEDIAAKADDGTPCCAHIGPDGAGHFVKMVHNGIEYADMQIICEAYWLMQQVLGMGAGEMSKVFARWNEGELSSYLVGITADILARPDAETGQPLVDVILDTAQQKGTGKWASQSALDLGVTTPTIADAVFARTVSAAKEERVAAADLLHGPKRAFTGDRAAFVERIRRALLAAKICAYAQGFQLMRAADAEYQWGLPFATIASVWRAGCIIRARLLEEIRSAYARHPQLANLLVDEGFAAVMAQCQQDLREVV